VGRADGRRDERRKGRHHQRQELRTAAAREFGDKGARRDEKDPIHLNRNVILVWTCIKYRTIIIIIIIIHQQQLLLLVVSISSILVLHNRVCSNGAHRNGVQISSRDTPPLFKGLRLCRSATRRRKKSLLFITGRRRSSRA
jgi:hypothetical protein